MSELSIDLIGGKELEAKLKELETKGGNGKKVVRTSVRNAQKILIPMIKANLSGIRKGDQPSAGMAAKIAAALQLKVPKQEEGSYSLHVRLRDNPEFLYYPKGSSSSLSTGKTSGERSYIPAAIEYGHGQNKKESARPYMRPAAYASVSKRLSVLSKGIWAGIDKVWKKK